MVLLEINATEPKTAGHGYGVTWSGSEVMPPFWQRLKRPFFVLAPMADVTDVVFRNFILCYSRPEVVYTEFIDSQALLTRKTPASLQRALWFSVGERPIVAQVFGADPAEMFACARLIRRLGFDGMDINMGCPDRRVEKRGAGAALIRDPPRAQAVIQAAKAGLEGLPLSVKTRLGYHAMETAAWIGAVLVAQPDVLVVHGRTRQELSAVPAHWEEIAVAARLAQEAGVLCVGNGDIHSREQGEDYAQRFGVDGIMIGRGVFGNPWVFAPRADRSEPEILQALADLITQFSGFWQTTKNDQILKKHFKAYVTGFPGSPALCARLLASQNAAEALDTLAAYFHHQGWPFPEPAYRRLNG